LTLTDPRHFFHSDRKVEHFNNVLERIRNLEKMYKSAGKGKMKIGEDLKEYILKADTVTKGAMKPCGTELVAKPFRMNSFLPMNTVLMCGILLSPPTMAWSLFWLWIS
jgi:hypothetical protein